MAVAFKDSQEAAFRRVVRGTIRKSNLSRGQRDVLLAFVNHWFHHKTKADGVVHPGRTKLAKKSGASVETVKRTLDMLRRAGVLTAVAHLNGLHGNATEYTVSVPHLIDLCGKSKDEVRSIGGSNDPTSGRVKMTHRLNDVSNVIPFAKRAV